jgi:hypothetical protein
MDAVQTAIVEVDEMVKVTAKLYIDEYPEFSDWGKFTDHETEFMVDTRRGWVLGEELPEPEEPDIVYPEEYNTPEEYEAAEEAYNKAYDVYDKLYDKWEDCPYEQLYETGADWDRGNYRYFWPDDGLAEMWADACGLDDAQERKAQKADVAEKAGKLYARIKDHGNGWNMCFMTVEITDNCAVVGSDTLGGIESDMQPVDWRGITSDILYMARDTFEMSGVDWDEISQELVDAVLDW